MGVLESLKKRFSYKGAVLITYGAKIGIFEIRELFRYKVKTGIKRLIMIVKEAPFPTVMDEAKEKGIEIIINLNPKQASQRLMEASKANGENVIIKPVDDIAERGMMEDPC